jgi:hypothetical protein
MGACPFAKTQKSSPRIAILFLSMLQPVPGFFSWSAMTQTNATVGKTAPAFDSMVLCRKDQRIGNEIV